MSNAQKPIFMKKKRSTRTIPASSLSLQLAMQKQQRQQQSAAAMSPPISGAKMTQMTAQTVIHCQLQLNARREKRGWGKGNSFYDVLASREQTTATTTTTTKRQHCIALHSRQFDARYSGNGCTFRGSSRRPRRKWTSSPPLQTFRMRQAHPARMHSGPKGRK